MRSLSSLPYFEKTKPRIIDRRENQYRVEIFADMVKIKRLDCPPPPHGVHKRAKVKGISKRSRKRMIELIAKIVPVPDFFATLTWSDDVASIEPDVFKKHFEAFRRRLEYYYEDMFAVWRIEVETRKSGERKGEPLVHFHLLIWMIGMGEDDKNLLLKGNGKLWREWWHEITGSTHEWHKKRYGLQLTQVKSRRHSYHYVSKYVSKLSEEEHEIGRRWGRIGQVDIIPVFEIEISTKQYVELKRLIASYWKRVSKWLSRKLSRQTVKKGLTSFRLGAWNDTNKGLFSSTIWRMLFHALEIADYRSQQARLQLSTA